MKNIKEFFGKPMLAYPIELAIRTGAFDAGIWVSTDSAVISKKAWQLGAKLHPRSKAMSENDIGTQEVVRNALLELWPKEEGRPEFTCCIYPCTPLVMTLDIRVGFAYLAQMKTYVPYVYAVGPDGKDAGAFYWGYTKSFIDRVPLDDPRVMHVQLPAERVCDINTQEDWDRAEKMYAALVATQVL
jgi:N-acylneuraminate cytidylyltransferase